MTIENIFSEVTTTYTESLNNVSRTNSRALIDKTILQKYYLMDIKRACKLMHDFLDENDVFLDFGNGVSPIAAIMSHFVKQVFACDILKEDWNLEWWTTMSKTYGHKQYIISGSEKLPHKDETFDGISMYAVLEHIGKTKKEIFSKIPEITRVLKKGGYLFIFRTPQKYSAIEYIEKKLNIPCHKVLLDTNETTREFEKNGYRVIEFEKYGILPDFWPGKLSDVQNKYASLYYTINKVLSTVPIINFFAHDMMYVLRKEN